MTVAAILVTILGYAGAKRLQARHASFHPLLVSTCLVWLIWWGISSDWETYKTGGEWISFWLGPATVALAVPLTKQIRSLLPIWRPVLLGVAIGCGTTLFSGWLVMWLAGGSDQLIRSILTKSVTTPFAVELTKTVGGIPELAAAFTATTGLIGAVIARPFLKMARITDDWAIGMAIGTSSHAIGTASLSGKSEAQAAASSVAMILSGIITTFYLIPF
ncbi:LrgB family protein [Brevibacillus migulae]|uniref:LrgB family protein n=1 Tax=Brevibacillus migulae TaxID=1644114 RepID=UPI00106ED22D|nr:LrgB family protein [Brevibacillus migulae]